VIGPKRDLQILQDLAGVLDPFLQLEKKKKKKRIKTLIEEERRVKRESLLTTDPAGHRSLILVEALDLGQVRGRGALHLEALMDGGGGEEFTWKLTFDPGGCVSATLKAATGSVLRGFQP